MTPAKFEEEISVIARRFHVVSLKEAVRRLVEGEPAEPVVAITFDDGYEDNYRVAFPILERYGIPTTIFLTTGSLDSREPLWFETLALAVKKSPHVSVDVELDVPRRVLLRNESERLRANDEIFWVLRNLPDSERQRRLREVLNILNAGDATERSSKMLTWNQVRWLKARGVDFGGHTVTHPFVSRLTREQATWEVGECKRRIQDELQSPVEHFAYPSGREIDFLPWNKSVIRDAGYVAAVSTLWGVNYPTTDPMELRRGQPWESTRSSFAAKLDWYQWLDA
jgi:peptidoglycan/xylan/chitin deacetylase (PgdA/CDA1 family)